MKRLTGGLTAVMMLGSVALVSADDNAPATRLTFYKDVLPILQESCQQCHRPGGDNISGMVAPMSLMTFQEVRPWARSIVQQVSAGTMPPWFASAAEHGIFENERTLTEQEVAILTKWVSSGASRGRAEDAPEPKVFAGHNGWLAGKPDLIVKMAEPFIVEDDIEDLYERFESKQITLGEMPEDRWVKSIEWRGGSSAVHHIVGYAASPKPDGSVRRISLGSIAPGEEAMIFPEGHGKLLPANSTITFSMHYHKEAGPGTAISDQSMVGFRFWDDEKEPPIIYPIYRNGISNWNFEIPPYHPNWEVGAVKTFERDTKILSLHPHMHLRGKDCRYVAVYPDGRRETLLDVPNFDFNWQLDYIFAEPKLIPAGTRVEYTAHFDNSLENPSNPDATIPMGNGGPTTMEMMIGYIQYADVDPVSPELAAQIALGESLPPQAVE